MPSPYSHSQLSTYENCPLRYKFSYIDRIESEEEGIEAFMGSRVHDALEKLYRDLRVSKLVPLEDIQSYFEDIWEKNWHEGINIVREEYTADNYRETGKRCIANYYVRNQPFDRDTTVSLEERLRIPIDEEEDYVLVGYVDRISKTPDGKYEIHDYKTSQTLPPQEKVDRDRQLSLYQIGLQHKWPDAKDVRLIWHYLVMDVDMISTRSEEDLQKVREDALELIGEIEDASEFEPRESALCSWCEFQDECPVKKHPTSLEGLPANEYLKDDGVQLVNKYVKAISKRRELQEEIEKLQEDVLDDLEEALFLYAQRENVRIVQGSGCALNLRRYKNYRFPSKKDELYQESGAAKSTRSSRRGFSSSLDWRRPGESTSDGARSLFTTGFSLISA
jgi:putative RecB family exonuclease